MTPNDIRLKLILLLICEPENEYPRPICMGFLSCRDFAVFLSLLQLIWNPYFNCDASAKHSNFKKLFPFANEQRIWVCFSSSSAPPSMNSLFPVLSCAPTTICNWTLKCRHANQVLIHLKLTGRPDYGSSFRLQTPYRHHLYRNTCRNMKELPGSISQSIVCQLCQQTEGKLSHTHLNPGV